MFTRINGRDYLVGQEEANCPFGNARIVDITDETRPVKVSDVTLAINRPEGCARALIGNDNGLSYMSHYSAVDNPDNASLLFLTWYNSGLRVFDIRDPARPVEVANFNPGVGGRGGAVPTVQLICTIGQFSGVTDAPASRRVHDSVGTYPRYIAATGQIWFGGGINVFNVVSLDPVLRPPAASPPDMGLDPGASEPAPTRTPAPAPASSPPMPHPAPSPPPVLPRTGEAHRPALAVGLVLGAAAMSAMRRRTRDDGLCPPGCGRG